MTFVEARTVTGSAESDDGLGQGSRVEVRVNPEETDRSFTASMDDIWRNVQGAMRSAGYHWTEDSMNAWVQNKAWENRAEKEGI
jgi:hypothetical protein